MRRRGFSLLEVIIAMALLALGLSSLYLALARSQQMAMKAHHISIATGLARMQLLECEADLYKKGFSVGDYKESGNFSDDDHDDFFWECYGYQPDIPTGDVTDIQEGMLGGLAGGAGGGEANPLMAQGAGMIAPVLAQVSDVVGKSVRELVVIIRWQEGEQWEEMQVVTHLIDLQGMQAIANQIRQGSKLLNQFGGGGGSKRGSKGGGTPGVGFRPPGGLK